MPSPYQTNCTDYSKLACKSRSNCINKCNVEVSLKQCNALPLSTNVDRHNDKNVYRLSNCSLYYNRSFCQEKYLSPNCINQYFSFKPFSDTPFTDNEYYKRILKRYFTNKTNQFNFKAFTSVTIKFGDEPDTIYTHSPQLYFIEFICFIGGVFSLWTGFSVMSIYAVGKEFFGRLNHNANQKAKIFTRRNAIYNIKK